MLSVSAFDLFIHEIYRLEVINRLYSRQPIAGLKVPFDALIAGESDRIEIVDQAVKLENSYKSFVAPDKVADCLRILVENPWDKISAEFGVPSAQIKSQLKSIVDLRNRIAHEADVNPAYAGIELWPIYRIDVISSISFLRAMGLNVAEVLERYAD